jgi:ADP-ribosyl-[dinitrogen reductase] hydrolase
MTSIEHRPSTEPGAIEDRAIGALLGLAIGDAIGTTLEFRARDTYEALTDMVGGGPFNLKVGEWTDDTAMALALSDSLEACEGLDEQDLLGRFVNWWRWGIYSCTGECFDIGITTRQALVRWQSAKDPHCGSIHPMSAGNGSLMRLAPVAIRFWNDRARLRDVAARQSKTTHAAPEAVDACIAFAEVLADAIEGRSKSDVLRARSGPYAGAIGTIMSADWRGKARTAIRSTGYVAHSLEASLWCVDRTTDYRDAVLMAANLGEDADTTAAITGQLAGALYGASSIPENWVSRVAWGEQIKVKATTLVGRAMLDKSYTRRK